jgi:hypothetical protein
MGGGSPWVVAVALGIRVCVSYGASFRVASTADQVACAWHPDLDEVECRVWDGIAQCLLERIGAEWTAAEASSLSRCLSGREVFLN